MTNFDYLYNKDVVKDYFGKEYFADKKLVLQIIKQGIIIPHTKPDKVDWWGISGIIDNQQRLHKGINTMQNVKFAMPSDINIKKSSKTVIYLGLFAPAWGHDLTINLRRLWFLNTETFKKDLKNCPIVYTPWFKKGWGDDYQTVDQKPNFPRLLEILGIDPNALQPITEPTQFENIIVPEDSFYYIGLRNFSFTQEYRETIDRIRDFAIKNQTPTDYKKIYLFYGRHQIGEERLATYFRTKGYLKVIPERLSLDDQLNLMINCESLATTLGSCAHNSIFLRDGMETIFIPRAAYTFTTYQQTLNELHPLNVNYIDSSLSVFGDLHESYCFILSGQLKKFFGDPFGRYTDGDFKTFFEYLKDSMAKGRDINPRAKKYYDSIFPDFFIQFWNSKG